MDISIIIVSWNVKDKLRANLEALLSSEGNFSGEIFVVDNNSSDSSVQAAKEVLEKIPPAGRWSWNIIDNQSNLGFAKANNQAINQAQGDFVLLLNPDMELGKQTIIKMLNWYRSHPEVSVAGCHLRNQRGKTIQQVRRFPKFWDQLAIILKLPHIFPAILNCYIPNNFDYYQSSAVDSLRGSFFMINRQRWQQLSGEEKPLLDERYFVWFEEVDFCRRVRARGGLVYYVSEAECTDYVGASFSQLPRGRAQKYFQNSMLAYFEKWEPLWQSKWLRRAWLFINRLNKVL